MKELKEDSRDYFRWAEKTFPDKHDELGLSFLLFDLECTLKNINDLIKKRYEDHKNQ